MSKVVLVTGASAGIGRATADRLQRSGWDVVGASRRGTGGDGWEGIVMDVADPSSVRSQVAAVVAGRGRLDAVVAAAGYGLAGSVEDTPETDAMAQLDTNFWGVVRVVQAALGPMRAAGGGRLVLMGSIGGVVALPFQAFYSAGKFALEGYAEALAYEVAPFSIAVTVVQPGNVATDFTENRHTVAGSTGDAYRDAAAKAIGKMAADEASGVPPDRVAVVVERVLTARRPPRRVSVGRAGERVGILAKRVMPFRAFEAAARSSLGV